jgi:hypothetical protein
MRLYPLVLLACAVLAEPVFAQQAQPHPSGEQGSIGQLPPSKPLEADGEHCVEVEIGGEKAYNCLNDQLKKRVERVAPVPNMPPIDSHSPDPKIGIVNVPAVKQQYGKNFGKSVVPYRPARP